jgi:polyhydroxyalkanoate synthesis repressor PhaR
MLKKYANRRLYDTKVGNYVKVERVRKQVLEGETVIEHDTGLDVTAVILSQIVAMDIEAGVGPSAAELRALIQLYSQNKRPVRAVA